MRHTHHRRHSKGAVAACLSALLFMGISFTASADTEIDAYHDGAGVTAFAISSNDVLSINIRVVGPNGYLYEERAEDSSIGWAPERDLLDGVYTWEVWTVTAERGAPMREISVPRQSTQLDQSTNVNYSVQTSDQTGADLDEIPLERFFAPEHKEVHTEAGGFRVEGGQIHELDPGKTPFSAATQPNGIQRFVGAVLDFLIPAAQAQDVTASGTPAASFIHQIDGSNAYRSIAFDSFWFVRETVGTGQRDPFVLEQGTPSTTIWVRSSGNVGLGTSTATAPLHISKTNPRIRLENTSDAQNWYINNVNQGRFEIRESTTGEFGAFTIDAGAPEAALYVRNNGRLEIRSNNPEALRISTGGVSTRFEAGPNAFVIKDNNGGSPFVAFHDRGADNNIRLVNNGVGFGATTPQAPIHVRRADDTSAMLFLEQANTGAATDRQMIELTNKGGIRFQFNNTNLNTSWRFQAATGARDVFEIAKVGTGKIELEVDSGGNLKIQGALTQGSDVNTKTGIERVDGQQLLTKLSGLSISEWTYKSSDNGTRHLGPMAQDFHAAFGLGHDETKLAPADMAGVALAAIKAQQEKLETQSQEIAALKARIETLDLLGEQLGAIELTQHHLTSAN